MIQVSRLFLLLSFLFSALHAAQAPQMISVEALADFAADLELVKSLAQHLRNTNQGPLQRQLADLSMTLEIFDGAFYRREVLSRYCDDPRDMRRHSDILSAAFRKDLDNPFSDGYNLNMLPLGEVDGGLVEVKTLSHLKVLGRYDQVIEMVRTGRLHFKCDFNGGYAASVKAHFRKFIITKMKDVFRDVMMKQIGFNMDLASFHNSYNINPDCVGHVGYMTIGTAKSIFINLPFIKITRK